MRLDDIEIRKMHPSEAEKVAEVDSYAYQNDPIPLVIYQSNSEEARKTREKNLIGMYTNNPQETYVALLQYKVIGLIRSFPCTGLFKQLEYAEGEHEHILNNKIEELTQEQRQKWWYMTMKKHDLQTPHSHVGPFAVLPEYQGKGVGSKLFEEYLKRNTGTTCYLETFTETNAEFYQKRGYALIETDDVLGLKGYFLRKD